MSELHQYLKEHSKTYPKKRLVDWLVLHGHNQYDVEQAYEEISQKTYTVSTKQAVFILCLVLIGIIATFVLAF